MSPWTSTDDALEQLLPPVRADAEVGAGADIDVIGPGDLDLVETADLIIARDRRPAVFARLWLQADVAAEAAITAAAMDLRIDVLLSHCISVAIQQHESAASAKKKGAPRGALSC